MNKNVTVFYKKNAEYPNREGCFRPSKIYPEYLFGDEIAKEKNDAYDMVREAFHLAEYDKEYFGTKAWNPLKGVVKENDTVVIKPNMVMHKNLSGGPVDCLYTQPSVVAAVVDYVLIALKGTGKIIIGDAPMQECDFEKLIQDSGYLELFNYYKSKGINISLVDFRELRSVVKAGVYHNIINEDAKGTVIDLRDESEFAVYGEEHLKDLRVTNYDPEILVTHHKPGKHEYYVSDYILNADVIINMPKPKTHRKAGVTISLKNLVGISVRKEYLPHHCNGDVASGGDEYHNKSYVKKFEAKLLDKINYASAHKQYKKAFFLKVVKKFNAVFVKLSSDKSREGSWYGNQTISKTITDLNKIIFYADKKGKLCGEKQRKLLIIADMIVSGEKEGPVLPSRKEVGVIAVGDDAVCFDEAIATLMGMDINKIPTIKQVRNMFGEKELVDKESRAFIKSNNSSWDGKYIEQLEYADTLQFKPTSGWKGHIEL